MRHPIETQSLQLSSCPPCIELPIIDVPLFWNSLNSPRLIYDIVKVLGGHAVDLSFLLITLKPEKTLFYDIQVIQRQAQFWLHFTLIFSEPPSNAQNRGIYSGPF